MEGIKTCLKGLNVAQPSSNKTGSVHAPDADAAVASTTRYQIRVPKRRTFFNSPVCKERCYETSLVKHLAICTCLKT